jgi:hypothetical protein
VLSVGRRCMEHGYAFHWEPWEKPVHVCPGGNKIIPLSEIGRASCRERV